ncbi:MAG: rhomboid family intramembrane serine protease [Planctomycetota bacterium]
MFFFIIPTGTDAPCYHWPFATFGMIWLNVVVLVLQFMFPEVAEYFILDFGSWNPIQWLTSSIMHAGIGHLVSNMIILAIVGYVIEGKVGWWRFIAIYFLIAAIAGCLVQTTMLFIGGSGALGASGVIFGMIAIVMIWAPENEVSFLFFALIFLYPMTTTFSASILIVSFLLLALEFLSIAFSGFGMSSAMLHLTGAMPGALIGYLMVQWRWVDCEGFDLMSIGFGRRGERVLTVQQEQTLIREKKEAAAQALEDLHKSGEMVEMYLAKGHFEMALNRYQIQRKRDKRFHLTEAQMIALINGLWQEPRTRAKAVPVMELYLKTHHSRRVTVALKLARHELLTKERPKRCLELIKLASASPMNEKETAFAKQLVAKAKAMIQSGSIEFSD